MSSPSPHPTANGPPQFNQYLQQEQLSTKSFFLTFHVLLTVGAPADELKEKNLQRRVEDGASENNKWSSSTRPVTARFHHSRIVRPFVTSHRLAQDVSWCACLFVCVCVCVFLQFYSHQETTRGSENQRRKKRKEQLGEKAARCLIQSDAYKLHSSTNQPGTLDRARSEAAANASNSAKKDVAKNVQVDPRFLLSQCDLRVEARKTSSGSTTTTTTTSCSSPLDP